MANSVRRARVEATRLGVSLNPNSPMPLYYQLQTLIRQDIADGSWKEEEMIPSEDELAAQFGISRGTVRTAINGLVQDGTLVRKQGKGTFVVPPNFRTSYIRFFHPVGDDPRDHVLPTSEVLGVEVAPPEDKVKRILKLTKADRVIVVRRLRREQDVPVVLEDIFLPKKYFPNFNKADLVDEPVYPTYAAKYQVQIVGADEDFEPRIADQEVAAALSIKPGDPVIFIERIAYAHDDRPVEYRRCTGRGDLFRYHVALGRRNRQE